MLQLLSDRTEPISVLFPENGNLFPEGGEGDGFNPFATINDEGGEGGRGEDFDPFQTIHDDDAFEVPFSEDQEDQPGSPSRFNPFDKEPDLAEKTSGLTPTNKPDDVQSPKAGTSSENSIDEPEPENQEPLDPYYPKWEYNSGWNLLLRQPFKKKLTQSRFWKETYVRIMLINESPVIRIYPNDKDQECLYELALQPSYDLCELGLQQLGQYGKCHTVKIQQVAYKESVGVKSERIAPTISDLTRVRDLKSPGRISSTSRRQR